MRCVCAIANDPPLKPPPQASPCAAETQCTDDCVQFKTKASQLPFTVTAEQSVKDSTTQFSFKVCSKSCKKGAAGCQALDSMFLRLEPTMLGAVKVLDNATVVSDCGSRGVGVEFSGKQLGKLSDAHPHKNKACHTFTLELEQAQTLATLCQQHVKATEGEDVLFEQREDTCTYACISGAVSTFHHVITTGLC